MMRILRGLVLGLSLAAAPTMAIAQSSPGKAIFEKNCASCHGADGKGNEAKAKVLKIDPAILNLGRDEVASQTRDEKKTITSNGKAKMPAYAKKLSPADLDAVTDHTMELIKAIRGK